MNLSSDFVNNFFVKFKRVKQIKFISSLEIVLKTSAVWDGISVQIIKIICSVVQPCSDSQTIGTIQR